MPTELRPYRSDTYHLGVDHGGPAYSSETVWVFDGVKWSTVAEGPTSLAWDPLAVVRSAEWTMVADSPTPATDAPTAE